MKAAGLKPIATVLETTAILIKSKHPSNPQLIKTIESRIRGVISELHQHSHWIPSKNTNSRIFKNIAAKKYVLCTYNVPRNKLETVTKITPGKRAPSVTMLEEEGWVAISVMVEKRKIADIMDKYVALSPSPKTTKYSCLNNPIL